MNDNSTTKDPLEISNIFNRYFTSVGHNLATQVPSSSHRFTDYLSPNNNCGSFFFDAVSPDDIEREILSIPKNKAYGLYPCPIRILTCAKHIVSGPLADIFNICVQKGVFPSNLKGAKVIPVYKSDDETDQVTRRCGSVYLGVVVLDILECIYLGNLHARQFRV